MPVPFGSLIPQRSRVLPQGGAVLGQLTGTFQAGLEQGRMRAAEEQAPDLLLSYLETQGQGYQPTLGNLAAPATGYVGGQVPAFNGMPTQENADLQTRLTPGSETFDGRYALREENARQQNPPPAPASAISYNYGDGTIRNQPVSSDLERVLNSAAAATGVSVVVSSGGQPAAGSGGARTGSTRHDDGGAADLQLVDSNGRRLDFTNPNDLPIIQQFIATARANGATGFGAGTDYMGNNTIHVGFGNEAVWGGVGENAPPAPEWLASAVSGGGPTMAGGAPSGGMPSTGGYSSQPAWSPINSQEWRQLRALMINPATRQMGYQLAIQRMTPPEPVQPNWQLQEFNGTLYRVDANTGQAQPVIQGQGGGTDPADIVTVNGQLVNRRTGEVVGDYRDPEAAPQVEPPETRNILMPDGNVYIMGFNPATGQFDQQIGLADPGGQFSVAVGADGAVEVVQGRPAAERPATEGQANANIYASRMEVATELIDQFATSGQNFWSGLVSGLGIVGNIALAQIDPQYQQFAQATRDFINASLRRESGAVISEEEFTNARAQYIPQPGDTPEVLEQKRQNRILQTQMIRQASGPFATQGGAPAAPTATPASSQQGAPATITGPADYDALAPGTPYTWLNPDTGQLEYFVKGANGG